MSPFPITLRSPVVRRLARRDESRSVFELDFETWLSYFTFNDSAIPYGLQQTSPGERQEQIAPDFVGFARGMYERSSIVFSCEQLRLQVGSQARFQWQSFERGRPVRLFGDPNLAILEEPWPNGTTGDLISRALLDADLGGNFFAIRRRDDTIKRLRPDWMTIVLGSREDPDVAPYDPDADVLGYIYRPGFGTRKDAFVFTVDEVAHFMPIPDAEVEYKGMSWLRPIIREVMADKAATQHKLRFFENGATPNMVVKIQAKDKAAFDKWVADFKQQHESVDNAYKTLFLTQGVDVEVVGKDLQQLEFKQTQAHGETRIAAAAGVPPILVGFSEGIIATTGQSTYPDARRRFTDGTMSHLWRNFAASIEKLVPGGPPSGATRLWYDDRDIPFLKDDIVANGQVVQSKATAIRTLVDAGFRPDSVVAAVDAGDLSLLVHSGRPTVQVQGSGSANGSSTDVQDAIAAVEAGRE